MNEFLNSILNQDIDTLLIIFLMFFSLGIAIFHTVIVSGLFEIKIKGWFLKFNYEKRNCFIFRVFTFLY